MTKAAEKKKIKRFPSEHLRSNSRETDRPIDRWEEGKKKGVKHKMGKVLKQ